MVVTDNLIIIGCSACEDGNGWIKFYDRASMQFGETVSGDGSDNGVGSSFTVNKDSVGGTQVWYGSKHESGVLLHLNSVYAEKNGDTWGFSVKNRFFPAQT